MENGDNDNGDNNKPASEEDQGDQVTAQQREAERTQKKVEGLVSNLDAHVAGKLKDFEEEVQNDLDDALGIGTAEALGEIGEDG